MVMRKRNVLAAAAVLAVAGVASAEDVYVKMPTARVKASAGAGADDVARLKKGDKLQVLGRQGSWVKVKVGDKEGYVHENSVSASGGGGGETGGLSQILGGASGSSAASSAEAGRGIGESLAYAKSHGMSTSGLDRMLAMRGQVSGAEWQRFTSEGNVGPAKQN
jgi:hypothetical protein